MIMPSVVGCNLDDLAITPTQRNSLAPRAASARILSEPEAQTVTALEASTPCCNLVLDGM